jgi:integrase
VGRQRLSIHTVWRSTRKRAKLGDLRFHDLRREAGSRWLDAGVNLGTIPHWLGHATISQTSTYLSAALSNDEAEMAAFEARQARFTYVDVSAGSNGPQPTAPDTGTCENTQQSPFVH